MGSNSATSSNSSEDYLFEFDNLTSISGWKEISRQLAEKNLSARPLKSSDYKNGYLEILSQLTEVGTISETKFIERFNLMKKFNSLGHHYMIVVIEDTETKRIVGASTLFLELKFIHECAIRGRLEEVVILDSYRAKGIGKIIVRIIVELAREVYKCYKLTLDCTDELKDFYARNNFTYGSNQLCVSFIR